MSFLQYLSSFGPFGFFVAVIVVFGTLAVIGLLIRGYFERRRREAMQRAAEDLGFTYHKDTCHEMEGFPWTKFDVFDSGTRRKRYNYVFGRFEDVQVIIFDYNYTIRSRSSGSNGGSSSRTYRQTIAAFKFEQAAVPDFMLKRERWYHKVGQVFGFKDIDFDGYPGFSRKYLLRGEDEDWIRRFFAEEAIQFFERTDIDYCVEGAGEWLIVYRPSKREKPARLRDMLTRAWEIVLTFKVGVR